jgi:hypothetical protein
MYLIAAISYFVGITASLNNDDFRKAFKDLFSLIVLVFMFWVLISGGFFIPIGW